MTHKKNPFAQEHKEMLEMLLRLHPGSHGVSIISRLIDHLSVHFVDEDHLMRSVCYPHRDRHDEDHYLIQETFLAHVPRIVSGNITQDEIDLLHERLLLHINTEDAEMFKFVLENAPEHLENE